VCKTSIKYHYYGDEIKEDGMGGGCSTYRKSMKGRQNLGGLGVDGRIILKWI
jgi:hypothetical protein